MRDRASADAPEGRSIPGVRIVSQMRATQRTAFRRIVAWLIDWACILGWVGVTAAIGVPLYRAGLLRPSGFATLNLLATLVVVVPAVLACAALEAGQRGATIGKRVLGLRVRSDGHVVGLPRALIRNTIKIGIPWILGHAAVYAWTFSSAGGQWSARTAVVLTVLAYVLPIAYLVGLFIRTGRTLYDVAARTTVGPVESVGG